MQALNTYLVVAVARLVLLAVYYWRTAVPSQSLISAVYFSLISDSLS
jgi:hypothetical protein